MPSDRRYGGGMDVPWLELLRSAIAAEGERPTVLSLASVDSNGDPQVRSVICREVGDDGSLWITSDSRSAKNGQLAAHPQSAAVFWAPMSRQQFRFAGMTRSVPPVPLDQHRLDLWRRLTPETRATFFWPAPGAPRQPEAPFVSNSHAIAPPQNFSVLVFHPEVVEHLDVGSHPHRRRRWSHAESWAVQELNP